MSTHSINITGVTTGLGPLSSSPPPRLPIFDVVKDPRAFSLLVQGLALMQKTDQSQTASHFQIGGIHGQPYVEWDGAGGVNSVSSDWEGYCTHGTVLFPTWHRPYVALYEQVLQAFVVQIASAYKTPDASTWQTTASNFRLPFWDWASNSVPPPQVISQKTVTIQVADGTTKTVNNPLYQYTFHNVTDGRFDPPWSAWNTTLRCPTSEDPDAETDTATLISNLTGPRGTVAAQIKHATYIMLSQTKQWVNFSNHSRDINPSYASSLESIHDQIHSLVGGDNGGHMSAPTVAAHDPIFFMHHCNVDRLTALWQAIHYTSFVPVSTAEDGTFMVAAGTSISETTPLGPFWKDAKTFWNSDACRSTAALGYTYPEFVGLDLTNQAQLSSIILSKVNTLYGSRFLPRILSAITGGAKPAPEAASTPNKPVEKVVTPPAAPKTASTLSTTTVAHPPTTPSASVVPATLIAVPPIASQNHPSSSSVAPASTQPSPAKKEDDGDMVDWRVRILTKKFALGGTYSVIIFLGDVPDDSSTWRQASTFVGTYEVFANIAPGSCANCRSRPDIEVEGTVFLNNALMHSGLKSYGADIVAPYLKDHLHWRVTQKGQPVDIASKLPELNVSVVEVPITMKPNDIAPARFGGVFHHISVTKDRVGGANEA